MPPKKEEPVKKKVEPPKELCGCGINTYRAPPKGKKKVSVVPEHAAGCTYQRTTCNRYPHLPKCASCEVGCAFCAGINPWCPHCIDNKCKFQFKRDLLAIGIKKLETVAIPLESAADVAPAASAKKPAPKK